MLSQSALGEIWKNPYVRVLVWSFVFYFIYQVSTQLQTVLVLALSAYTIAYLFNPILSWLQKWKISRALGIFLVFVILIAIAVTASLLFITILQQFSELVSQLPTLFTKYVQPFLEKSINWINTYRQIPELQALTGNFDEIIRNASSQLTSQIQNILKGLLSSGGLIVSGVVSVTGYVFQGVIMMILSAYLMADFSKIGLTLLGLVPRAYQPFALDFSGHISTAIGGYLRGQLVIATAVGTLIGLGLTLIGVPNAIALGFLAGAFNIVPYLGVVIGIAPAILLGLTISPLTALLVVIIFVVVNQIEGNFLSPYILGKTTNLHPATVLLSIMIGLTLIGIPGALLGVPLAALGKLMLQAYYFPSRTYRRKLKTMADNEDLEPLTSEPIIVPPGTRQETEPDTTTDTPSNP